MGVVGLPRFLSCRVIFSTFPDVAFWTELLIRCQVTDMADITNA